MLTYHTQVLSASIWAGLIGRPYTSQPNCCSRAPQRRVRFCSLSSEIGNSLHSQCMQVTSSNHDGKQCGQQQTSRSCYALRGGIITPTAADPRTATCGCDHPMCMPKVSFDMQTELLHHQHHTWMLTKDCTALHIPDTAVECTYCCHCPMLL